MFELLLNSIYGLKENSLINLDKLLHTEFKLIIFDNQNQHIIYNKYQYLNIINYMHTHTPRIDKYKYKIYNDQICIKVYQGTHIMTATYKYLISQGKLALLMQL